MARGKSCTGRAPKVRSQQYRTISTYGIEPMEMLLHMRSEGNG